MSKKILIHTIVFSPDSVSTAYLYNDIARKFHKSGYEVVVLTTTPHYNVVDSELKKQKLKRRLFGLYFESEFQGIKVKHVPQKKFKSTILRIFGFIYWHTVSLILGLFEKKVNYILSPSPPLTIGFINLIMAKLKRAKVIYNVQEIYPDLLIQESGLKSKVLISILKRIERTIYNKSDAVVTIDELFYNTIVNRFKDSSKLNIIPNFVDTEIYHPIAKSDININKSIFPIDDNIKVMYIGNIGFAQDWDTLMSVVKALKDKPFSFYVIGDGAQKDMLKKEKKDKGLTNLHIISYQQRETIPDIISHSDIQFIFMNKSVEKHGFPSKVYTIMACAKTLLVSSGEDTPVVNFLKDKNCSFLVTKTNVKDKADEIVSVLNNLSSVELDEKGYNGYQHIQKKYTTDIVTKMYVQLIEKL